MVLFIQIVHVLLSLFLILIILLQPGKDSGAVFGGQSGNSAYSARTNANPLGRATTVVAVMFMSTSISLAWFSTVNTQDSEEMEKNRQKLGQRLTKKDLEFDVPKLPFLQISDLVAPKPPPVEEKPEGEEIPSDGLTPEE